MSFDRYSSDDAVQARVAKLRIERDHARDTVAPGRRALVSDDVVAIVGVDDVVTVPASAKRAQIDRDIRRALLGDVVHDSGRTRVPASTSTTSVQVPASRGLTLVGRHDPTLEAPCTQGAVASLANATREARQDRAREHAAMMAAKAAKRERNREARRRRAR